jgi:hypothetical protein
MYVCYVARLPLKNTWRASSLNTLAAFIDYIYRMAEYLEPTVNTLHMLYCLDNMCSTCPPPTPMHFLSQCTIFL